MSQLYARVFTQILDSSIAEDFKTRHIFEDFLKVCSTGESGGVVDMTRQALARRFNVPLDELNFAILKLESPDQHSRDQSYEGRRIQRLDDHRDWGWQILNWKEYDNIRTRAESAARVAKHRAMKQTAPGTVPSRDTTPQPPPPIHPSLDMCQLQAAKIGISDIEAEKFWNYHEARGWIGKSGRIKSWTHAMTTWKLNLPQFQKQTSPQKPQWDNLTNPVPHSEPNNGW